MPSLSSTQAVAEKKEMHRSRGCLPEHERTAQQPWLRNVWVQMSALPLSSHGILGKLLIFSRPQFLICKKGLGE